MDFWDPVSFLLDPANLTGFRGGDSSGGSQPSAPTPGPTFSAPTSQPGDKIKGFMESMGGFGGIPLGHKVDRNYERAPLAAPGWVYEPGKGPQWAESVYDPNGRTMSSQKTVTSAPGASPFQGNRF